MARIVSKEDSGIRLSSRGEWFHHGEPFEHKRIIRFFHRSIRRDGEGNYYLYNKIGDLEERVYFDLEDTAFFVKRLDFDAEQKTFRVLLNNEEEEFLDVKTLYQDERGIMYCQVREGDRARLTQGALMTLSEYAEQDEEWIYLDVTGEKVILSQV